MIHVNSSHLKAFTRECLSRVKLRCDIKNGTCIKCETFFVPLETMRISEEKCAGI